MAAFKAPKGVCPQPRTSLSPCCNPRVRAPPRPPRARQLGVRLVAGGLQAGEDLCVTQLLVALLIVDEALQVAAAAARRKRS